MRLPLVTLLFLTLTNSMFSRATHEEFPNFKSAVIASDPTCEMKMEACPEPSIKETQQGSELSEKTSVKTASMSPVFGGINGFINVICFIPKVAIVGFNLYIIWFVLLRKKTWARESAMV